MNRGRTPLQLVESLFARINYERQHRAESDDFKLANMIRFMNRLGDPHFDYPVIHVAGTKGKGSVSAMLGGMLTAAGIPNGVYSSPHLERINQRIRINGQEISDFSLNQTLAKLMPVIDEFDTHAQQAGLKRLTFFEVITATACQAFADQELEAVVLEVGMGGRLDSTNVCRPSVSVITSISLDHTRQLGSTVDKIAFEKAGIIKPGIPVVSGVNKPQAAAVIRDVAQRNGSRLYEIGTDFEYLVDYLAGGFSYSSATMDLPGLKLGMVGEHQMLNASVAIAVAEVLIRDGWKLNEPSIRAGLKTANLAGRCELFHGQPLVVLDIAHNMASMRALADTLTNDVEEFRETEEKTMILSVSRDKDLTELLKPVIGIFDRFVITKYVDNPRARPVEDIEKCLIDLLVDSGKTDKQVFVVEDPAIAWQTVLDHEGANQAICITGSVFLVAELRPIVMKWADNR